MKSRIILPVLFLMLVVACKNQNQEGKAVELEAPGKSSKDVLKDSVSVGQTNQTDNEDADASKKALAEFYTKNTKAAQVFSIDTSKDTTLICAEKTRITIRANSFVSQSGREVVGKVEVSVKEYYSISDIILAKLSTTSNGELLETGGMLYISATSNAKECSLKKEKTIELEFPAKLDKPGMELYSGEWKGDLMNWQLAENPVNLNQVFPTSAVDVLPEFPGGLQKMYRFISDNVIVPDGNGSGKLVATFLIDQNGKLENIRIHRGLSRKIDAEVIRVLKKLPNFKPGKVNGKPVRVQYCIPIQVRGSGNTPEYGSSDFEKDYNDSTLKNAKSAEIRSYLFSSSGLGWINCDRLWKYSTTPKVDYAVHFSSHSQTSVFMVFHRFKSIMNGGSEKNSVTFATIPSDEAVTIFAISFLDGMPFLAVRESVTSDKPEINLAFEPVTMDKLKREIEKLDRFN